MTTPSSEQLRQRASQLKAEIGDAIRRLMQCAQLTAIDLASLGAAIHLSSDEHDPNRVALLRRDPQSSRLAADVRIEGEAERWDEQRLTSHLGIEQLLDLLDGVQRHATPQLRSVPGVNVEEHAGAGDVTLRFEAFGGNRAANLEAIAEAIQALTPREGTAAVTLEVRQARSLWGWAEQLMIIAAAIDTSG